MSDNQVIPEAAIGKSFGTAGPGSGVSADMEVPIVRTGKPVVTVVEPIRKSGVGRQVIPDAAVEAAARVMQAKDRSEGFGEYELHEYTEDVTTILEAAAPHIKKQALDDAALETLRRGDVGKDGGIKVDVFLMWRARQEAGTAPWGVGR